MGFGVGEAHVLLLYPKGVCVHNVHFPGKGSEKLTFLKMPVTPERCGPLSQTPQNTLPPFSSLFHQAASWVAHFPDSPFYLCLL